MIISFLDLSKGAQELLNNDLMNNVENIIKSGHYLFGPKMQELESIFSKYFNSNAILVGSGTDALAVSLKALGVKYGDFVAVPALSAIPTAVAVKMVGAQPLYVDIDDSMTMNVGALEEALDIKNVEVKAIIPVHLYGNTADMVGIKLVAERKHIPIIEDCAQSFGSKIDDNLAGTFGDLGAFSFYPTKNLGTFGDGGLIITKNEKLAQWTREIRFYGQTERNKMGYFCGMNSRMDEIQCSILLKKMETIEQKLEKRKQMKIKYDDVLKSLKHSWRPDWHEGAVPHLYPLLSTKRKEIMEKLSQAGIEALIHYPFCLPEEIDKTYTPESWKAKKYSERVFSVPFHPWLADEEIEYILKTLLECA